MAAVEIAEVVSSICEGDFGVQRELREYADRLAGIMPEATVVDCTKIYYELTEIQHEVYLYEDHSCLTPSFDLAAFCYVNEHGNVVVMETKALDVKASPEKITPWQNEEENFNWDEVQWVAVINLWVGGYSKQLQRQIKTVGPLMRWDIAIDADGKPLDIRWTHLFEAYSMEYWDMASLVLLRSMAFLACTNVDLVEPTRPRHERRRIERASKKLPDLRINTIQVFPNNKRYVGRGKNKVAVEGVEVGGVGVHRVRGHFATYGSEGRGLLFGKYAGRFFIPPHSRGKKEYGEIKSDYKLVPDKEVINEGGI